MVFLTSTSTSNPSITSPLGSFVYALPTRSRSRPRAGQTLHPDPPRREAAGIVSTLLIQTTTKQDESASRIAHILATKLGRPVYLGYSVGSHVSGSDSFEAVVDGMQGMGTVEEEMNVVRTVVRAVTDAVEGRFETAQDPIN